MTTQDFSRRSFLAAAAAVVPAAQLAHGESKPIQRRQNGLSPWPLTLNTSTIRPASLEEKVRVTAATGWDGIEPWINELEEYENEGGDLKELARRITDLGLYVPNVIGLWSCMPDTQEAYEESLTATRERMRRAAAVGSLYVAAIPAPDRVDFDLKWGAEMYRDLMRIGREDYGIKVAFEFVGFLKGVHRFGQACAVAMDANDAEACLIMDTFHLFRGGSGFNAVQHVQGSFIADFHWNDVPGDIPREEQGDEHRIYPGDGILPLTQALRDLKAIGYERTLSLELFNRAHWEQPPEKIAAEGRDKMLACITAANV